MGTMETLGQWAYDLAEFLLNLLPASPFQFIKELSNGVIAEWLPYINWFIPVQSFVAILEAWASAIMLYYVYQIGLRWAKAIQ